MNNFFVRLIACLMADKSERERFLNKYLTPSPKQIQAKLQEIISRINDLNYSQNIITDYYMDAEDAKKATGGRKIRQQKLLKVLKRMDEVCREQNIEYWTDWGTCLGVFRHKGFIPWDDDCDTAMTLNNYRKFKALVESGIYADLEGREAKEDGVYKFKLKDDKTLIDIFAYDEFEERIIKSFRPIHIFPRYGAYIPKSIIFPLKKRKFENIELYSPKDIELYLKCLYGDYYNLPHGAPVWEHNGMDNVLSELDHNSSLYRKVKNVW